MDKNMFDVSVFEDNEVLILEKLGIYYFYSNKDIVTKDCIDSAELYVKELQLINPETKFYQDYLIADIRLGGVITKKFNLLSESFDLMFDTLVTYNSFMEYFKGSYIKSLGKIR